MWATSRNRTCCFSSATQPRRRRYELRELSAPGLCWRCYRRTLGESDVRGRYGVTVVAVKHDAYTAVLHPEPSEKVDIGDTIVAMGTDVDLRKLPSACEKDTS